MLAGMILCLMIISMNIVTSSSFLDKLRRQKIVSFQSTLSSPLEMSVNEGSTFRLTCSFLSNFDQLNIFWFHNGILIQSFISKSILEKEDDEVENSFLAVTIVSTIEIERTHLDLNGIYQCIGIHKEITAKQNFLVHIVQNEGSSIKTNFASDAFITVHTYQSLFEPRMQTTLMCRFSPNRKDQCSIQWFDPEQRPLKSNKNQTDLILKDANFEDNMGLYTCQICCQKQCSQLTTFVYPAGSDN